jgi:hypothetical protein
VADGVDLRRIQRLEQRVHRGGVLSRRRRDDCKLADGQLAISPFILRAHLPR